VVRVDQDPIGRTPRSNPATYTGLFTPIRELFALLPEAQGARLQARTFLLQRQGWAAVRPARVTGLIKIEMHFLPTST